MFGILVFFFLFIISTIEFQICLNWCSGLAIFQNTYCLLEYKTVDPCFCSAVLVCQRRVFGNKSVQDIAKLK